MPVAGKPTNVTTRVTYLNDITHHNGHLQLHPLEEADSLIIRANSATPGYATIADSATVVLVRPMWITYPYVHMVKSSSYLTDTTKYAAIQRVVSYPDYDAALGNSLDTIRFVCHINERLQAATIEWSVQEHHTSNIIDATTTYFHPTDRGLLYVTSDGSYTDSLKVTCTITIGGTTFKQSIYLYYEDLTPPVASSWGAPSNMDKFRPWHFWAYPTANLSNSISYIPRSKTETSLAGYRWSFPNVCRQRNQLNHGHYPA